MRGDRLILQGDFECGSQAKTLFVFEDGARLDVALVRKKSATKTSAAQGAKTSQTSAVGAAETSQTSVVGAAETSQNSAVGAAQTSQTSVGGAAEILQISVGGAAEISQTSTGDVVQISQIGVNNAAQHSQTNANNAPQSNAAQTSVAQTTAARMDFCVKLGSKILRKISQGRLGRVVVCADNVTLTAEFLRGCAARGVAIEMLTRNGEFYARFANVAGNASERETSAGAGELRGETCADELHCGELRGEMCAGANQPPAAPVTSAAPANDNIAAVNPSTTLATPNGKSRAQNSTANAATAISVANANAANANAANANANAANANAANANAATANTNANAANANAANTNANAANTNAAIANEAAAAQTTITNAQPLPNSNLKRARDKNASTAPAAQIHPTTNRATPAKRAAKTPPTPAQTSQQIANEFVFSKLTNQCNFLMYLARSRAGAKPQLAALADQIAALRQKSRRCAGGGELFGTEGAAARVYWAGIALVVNRTHNGRRGAAAARNANENHAQNPAENLAKNANKNRAKNKNHARNKNQPAAANLPNSNLTTNAAQNATKNPAQTPAQTTAPLFCGRHKRGASDPFNCALNYGYAMLLARVQVALAAAGLAPNASFLHAARADAPTLAFDFIEQFRAFVVDRAVVALFNLGVRVRVENGLLTAHSRKAVAGAVAKRLAAKIAWRGERRAVEEVIFIQARRLAASISNGVKFRGFVGKF